ncbi:sigma-70 family RNA polymerase sigma factor [Cytobacillus dafuensis]|uniref:Sigma-70 family RNA polymerase sigma factor n=1 Tax=Cytobacillus dafuensis TaxID=1742359 RepID=A0A5B8Z4T2_CYTDA|nr:sigma-70 family RNA polymerase sigma factor [Cytobacillus dafuensis]QED47898.1 sigma-70 family RNA polymerase sigma factor [Cytobacillus dafuensis]
MDLDEVYKAYVKDLYRYLLSLSKNHFTAEDLVQEAFYRAYIQLEDYEINNIKAWLFKVAYNAFIDFTRKNKKEIIENKNIQLVDMLSPEKKLLEKESFELLMNEITSLNDKEKHVLLLCDLNQLSLKEAAEILDLNLNTLKSHLVRGRKKMIERIKERRKADERST